MTNSIELDSARFDLLPDDAKIAIQQFPYDEALRAIHTTHRLHIDQASALEKNISDIIFGVRKSYDLIPHIVSELHVKEEEARTIAFDVNDRVLKPLQLIMKKLQVEEK